MKRSMKVVPSISSAVVGFLMMALASGLVVAQETVCARVKIEIKQELTLERQGFDAEMRINNALDNASLTDVDITVRVTEESGAAVAITTDPNDLSARFFIRVSNKQNIGDISGNGSVAASSTAVINWLLIPAPGAAGNNPLGKKYLIGATLKYKFGGETHTLDVSPDVVTVKPLPLLSLDYFLTKDVIGDDPMTDAIEPVEPFTLGVRIKNTGMATAKGVKIDSAQPKIVENLQGLAINFRITGSYVNDAPVSNTLLINFGDIPANTGRMGRWIMESSLAGQFVDFTASFSHADELGGALTSILQSANAHLLIRDVRVDLPGRDLIRDFLAQDGDVIRVYESEGADSTATDQSAAAALSATGGNAGLPLYRLTMPATPGFVYVRLPDPFGGAKVLGTVMRSDAKAIPFENIWFSRTKNRDTGDWQYWINLFDANSPGLYDVGVKDPVGAPRPPVLQFIADRIVKEGQQISFLAEASSPDGKAVAISAAPLPVGAKLTVQGGGRAVFDWTPAKGQAGSYPVTFTASDGALSATRIVTMTVETSTPPPGPGTPTVESPLAGAHVPSLKPVLKVMAGQSGNDPSVNVVFELYSDAAMTQKVAEGAVAKNPVAGRTTDWEVPTDLNDNTWFWWRARAFDGGTLYSPWANGRFFANLFNDAPEPFNLTNPAAGAEVASLTPDLSLTNSVDKDGDAITYAFRVYADAALTQPVAEVDDLPPADGGTTTWTVAPPLSNHGSYYWRAVATDGNGAQTQTPVRLMVVNTGNTAPTVPEILAPLPGGQSTISSVALTVRNASDAESDPLVYVFEIDTVPTFDSGNRRASGPLPQGDGGVTVWSVSSLVENQRYFWRAKAFDGRAESAWSGGDFLMNAVNEAPPLPTVKNPGNAAWVATQMPTFEANPVLDPENDAVRYRFEVYTDAALTKRVAAGVSDTPQWMPRVALEDKATHYWRLRAEDALGAASAWSASNVLYVSSLPYMLPTISVTSPATPTDGRLGKVTIRWEGTDPNINPNIALYYDRTGSGFAGVRIVDGLKQGAGTVSGSYEWDVSTLAPGAYYIYAVIYDAKGAGKAYAPGAAVIPTPSQTGGVSIKAREPLRTDEKGKQASFTVRLTKAPAQNVVIGVSSSNPNEGKPTPETLTFTPQNWNVQQTVAVAGQEDCARDGRQDYKVILGRASSLDPNYIGIAAGSVSAINEDRGDQFSRWTDNRNISICNYRLLGKQKVDRFLWEYVYEARLTNIGPAVSGVRAYVQRVLPWATVTDGELSFGAVGVGETVKSRDTFVLRTRYELPASVNPMIYWKVTTQ